LGSKASGRKKNTLALLACGVLCLAGGLRIHAQAQQTASSARPAVLIAVLPLAGQGDPGVRKVLISSLRFRLEEAGLQVRLFTPAGQERPVEDLLGDRQRNIRTLTLALLELDLPVEHEFLAVAGYIKEGEEIQVDFSIADLEGEEILASASRRVRIDFDLDEAMIRTIGEMLPQAAARIEEAIGRRALEEAEAGAEMETVEEQKTAAVPEEALRSGMEEPAADRFRTNEFSIGFAPYIPVGATREAFDLSYVPFLYWNYRIALSTGVLGIGIYTALNLFEPEQLGLAAYFHRLVPVGLDARYSLPVGSRLGLIVRASLGAAFNVSDFSALPPSAQEELSRFLAYGLVGVGAAIAFSPNVGLAIDFMYETFLYFWQPEEGGKTNADWIMGLMPAIYLYTRL
jgi:hypothetical protein